MKNGWRIAAGALSFAAACAGAAEFRREDYAYVAPIVVPRAAPTYVLPVPVDVYRTIAFAGLTDVAVVNGLGELVPYAIRRPGVDPAAAPSVLALPLYPLADARAEPPPALRLRLQSGTTSVDIATSAAVAGAPAASAAGAYLLDARAATGTLTHLAVTWPGDAPDFSAHVRVESGRDVDHFATLVQGIALVNLHYANQSFVRAEFDVPPTVGPFLRISWEGTPPRTALTGVTATQSSAAPEPARTLSYADAVPGSAPGEYDFDLGARLPVDRLTLVLPEPNTVADAEFLSRDSSHGVWKSVAHARLYRLAVDGAADLSNAPVPVAPERARYWRVRIAGAGGGLGRGTPRLEAGWRADEVLFVARGAPPFSLVFGNGAAGPTAVAESVLRLDAPATGASGPRRAVEPVPATLGPVGELGGEDRLVVPTGGPDRRRWLLWTVLIAGVALLAWMALGIARETGRDA